jgi:hypothetical protein
MSNDTNWMRRKFLQASSLLGAGLLLNRTASAQHEGHQRQRNRRRTARRRPGNPRGPTT